MLGSQQNVVEGTKSFPGTVFPIIAAAGEPTLTGDYHPEPMGYVSSIPCWCRTFYGLDACLTMGFHL